MDCDRRHQGRVDRDQAQQEAGERSGRPVVYRRIGEDLSNDQTGAADDGSQDVTAART
jgi:hypothetical protein